VIASATRRLHYVKSIHLASFQSQSGPWPLRRSSFAKKSRGAGLGPRFPLLSAPGALEGAGSPLSLTFSASGAEGAGRAHALFPYPSSPPKPAAGCGIDMHRHPYTARTHGVQGPHSPQPEETDGPARRSLHAQGYVWQGVGTNGSTVIERRSLARWHRVTM